MAYFDRSLDAQPFAEIGARLLGEVDVAEPRLRDIGEDRAAARPAPGTWSGKEILGHLIDSAANNHLRLVHAQRGSPISLPGYDQDQWVRSQRYDERFWADIIELWCAYNRHLAHVITGTPETLRDVRCAIGDNAPVTLSHVALDYVGHLQHHLRQVYDRT